MNHVSPSFVSSSLHLIELLNSQSGKIQPIGQFEFSKQQVELGVFLLKPMAEGGKVCAMSWALVPRGYQGLALSGCIRCLSFSTKACPEGLAPTEMEKKKKGLQFWIGLLFIDVMIDLIFVQDQTPNRQAAESLDYPSRYSI